MNSFGWSFPATIAGQRYGFNHSGVYTFKSTPLQSVVREMIQNSMDARKQVDQPVQVSFELLEKRVEEIPDYEKFKLFVSKCVQASNQDADEKGVDFFKNASRLLHPDKALRILKIKDSNTWGLGDTSDGRSRWESLVKSQGVTTQANGDAGGSFGIGKDSVFIASQLRAVFVSTLFEKEGELNHWTQGKAIFRSFNHDEVGLTQDRGYWGICNDDCEHMNGFRDECPTWLQHCLSEDELVEGNTGTTVSVLGFNDNWVNWEKDLKIAVAVNYFSAIYHQDLTVNIQGVELNRDVLIELFDSEQLVSYMEESDSYNSQHIKTWKKHKSYFQTLLPDDNVKVVESALQEGLGLVKLRVLKGEGFAKKIAAIRNGIFITEDIHNQLNSGFGQCEEFIATFECLNEDGNEILRKQEPPQHNEFKLSLVESDEERSQIRRAMLELGKWIKATIKGLTEIAAESIDEITDLSEFFADDETDNINGNNTNEIDPLSSIAVTEKKQKVPSFRLSELRSAELNEGGGDIDVPPSGDEPGSGDDGFGPTVPGTGVPGEGPGLTSTLHKVSVNEVRLVRKLDGTRILCFTPTASGDLRVSLGKSGADSDQKGSLISSAPGHELDAQHNLLLEASANERVQIPIEVTDDYCGSFTLKAFKVITNEV